MLIVASDSLDRKKVDTAEDNLKKSENDESGDAKHSDEQEKKESMERSYPPFFRESDQGSSKHGQCKASSIIPEPPSSPSIASLEEDENTPSLGLEDDDWVMKHFIIVQCIIINWLFDYLEFFYTTVHQKYICIQF